MRRNETDTDPSRLARGDRFSEVKRRDLSCVHPVGQPLCNRFLCGADL
jgi:hypothetical protein